MGPSAIHGELHRVARSTLRHAKKTSTYKNKMVAPLVELTSELLARASSTSEVLTLNLTNLLILIVLKAIIFGFGLFSVGSSARSSEDTSLSQADLSGGMCFIMYTSGAEEVFNSGKGYAFITMDDERDAKAAIDELNGTTIDGQEVKVELSKPRSGGGGGGRDRDRGYGGGRDRRGGGGGFGGRDGGRDRGSGGGRDRDGGRGGGRDNGRRDYRGGGGGGRRDDHDDCRDRDRSYNRRDDY